MRANRAIKDPSSTIQKSRQKLQTLCGQISRSRTNLQSLQQVQQTSRRSTSRRTMLSLPTTRCQSDSQSRMLQRQHATRQQTGRIPMLPQRLLTQEWRTSQKRPTNSLRKLQMRRKWKHHNRGHGVSHHRSIFVDQLYGRVPCHRYRTALPHRSTSRREARSYLRSTLDQRRAILAPRSMVMQQIDT